jgi:hypothetical protein
MGKILATVRTLDMVKKPATGNNLVTFHPKMMEQICLYRKKVRNFQILQPHHTTCSFLDY